MLNSKLKTQNSSLPIKIKGFFIKLSQKIFSKIPHPFEGGFTLLELLVSISIIGVLVSLGAVSYTSAQKKSRDAKRQGDLKAIQNAFEQYYSNCGYVYPTAMPEAGSSFSCGSTTLLEQVPVDPKTASPYPSGAAFSSDSYKICAETEVIPTPYCVSNLQ